MPWSVTNVISLNVVQAPNIRWWCFNRIFFQQHFAQSLAQTRGLTEGSDLQLGVPNNRYNPVILGSEGKQLSPGFDQHIARQMQWSSSQHFPEQTLRIYLGDLKIFCDPSEHKKLDAIIVTSKSSIMAVGSVAVTLWKTKMSTSS